MISFLLKKIHIIFTNFIRNYVRYNIIEALRLAILDLYNNFYPNKITRISLNILGIMLLFNPEILSWMDGDIQTCVSNIFNAYLSFIYILRFSVAIISDPSLKEKFPLFYNFFVFRSSLILITLASIIFFNLNTLFSIIINKIMEFIENFIWKMMGIYGPRSNPQPGGFGQPSGGGGKPPPKTPEEINHQNITMLKIKMNMIMNHLKMIQIQNPQKKNFCRSSKRWDKKIEKACQW